MLAEYLADSTRHSQWVEAIPGVRVCFFSSGEGNFFPPAGMSQHQGFRFETFFCQSGSMDLVKNGTELHVEHRDILLLSDLSAISSARVRVPLKGILVQTDEKRTGPSMGLFRTLLGDWEQCVAHIQDHMSRYDGCRLLHATPWNQSVFAAIDSIAAEKRGMYCVLKTAELIYLLYSSPVFKTAGSAGGYVSKTIEDVRKYMERHMDEKLTIAALSHQFHISPTALKSGFRQLYGIPIHRWLQNHRMNHAAELLRGAPMTVLQVAQTVGYEGLSQFNITFRQQFGMTPVQYKKMSNSINF